MIRRFVGAGLFILAALFPMTAQSGDKPSPSLPSGDAPLSTSPYERGEQTIGLAASVQFPLALLPDSIDDNENELLNGGAFSFCYQYFLGPGLAIGGTLSGAFNGTIASRSLFVAPLSFRTAYWWALSSFEFFTAAEAGGYIMRFDGRGMLGPFGKAGLGALWQTGTGWSVGIQANYWFVPEIHYGEYADLTRYGHFLETGLIAIYHL